MRHRSVSCALALSIAPVCGAQFHGITSAKVCQSPVLVGDPVHCEIVVTNGDGFLDTWVVLSAWDVVESSGGPVRVPVSGDLPIDRLEGNAIASGLPGSPELPVYLGAPGSTFNTAGGQLPGDPDAGSVIFRQDTYVADEGDVGVLFDTAHVTVRDMCDHPDTQACFFFNQGAVAGAGTVVLPDCNRNGVADADDIAMGTSTDLNGNGVPDDCEDCNGNGVPDDLDILNATSPDTNANGIPDECEDCNNNGVFDGDDIANGTSADYDLNGIPDECETPFGGGAFWIQPAGGLFRLHSNWDPGTPGSTNTATFALDPFDYTVLFDLDAQTDRLRVTGGNVTLDLGGHIGSLTYELLSANVASIAVGETTGDDGALVVTGGTLAGVSARIGDAGGAVGALTIQGHGAQVDILQSLCVGCAGDGTMTIADGATVISRDAAIGDLPGSTGDVVVTGTGSLWDVPFFLIVNNGTLFVDQGAVVSAGFDAFGGIFLFDDAMLSGEGTIVGNLVNFADLAPGADPGAGTLTVDGDYFQVGQIPNLGDSSGRLTIDIDGTVPGLDHDVLDVSGTATLGGGLLVTSPESFAPAETDTFDIITAPVVIDAFDVALLPGLPPPLFMTLSSGLGPGGSGVTVEVESLSSLFDFGDPQNVGLDGAPSAVVAGDVDGINGIDLVVTIPDPDPSTAGKVLVLYNAGTDAMGVWQGFLGSVEITVGVDPSDVAIGLFDGDGAPDLAVSNRTDDTVSVLINDGSGGFLPPSEVGVGSLPSAVAPGDFNNDDLADLVVTNQGDDSVLILQGDGAGGFPQSMTVPGVLCPIDVEPADIDNDKFGEQLPGDIIVMGCDGTIIVFVNEPGGFGEPLPLAGGPEPVDLAIGDLDGNGFVDIITLNGGDDTTSIILNEGVDPLGELQFTPAVNLPVGTDPRSVTTIDVEQDGDLDLALITDDDMGVPGVQVLRNDGGTQLIFATPEPFPAVGDPVLVTKGDLDVDTLEDLIVLSDGFGGAASGPNAAIEVRLNTTDGCFGDLTGPGRGDPPDGTVNVFDLLVVLANFGTPGPDGDVTGAGAGDPPDGTVDVFDLLAVIGAFGPCL